MALAPFVSVLIPPFIILRILIKPSYHLTFVLFVNFVVQAFLYSSWFKFSSTHAPSVFVVNPALYNPENINKAFIPLNLHVLRALHGKRSFALNLRVLRALRCSSS